MPHLGFLGIILLLSGLGVDIMSAFSTPAATMGNVGPGFGLVSSMSNFSQIPEAGKWVLSVTMLTGRLEIFGFILFLMFTPMLHKCGTRINRS